MSAPIEPLLAHPAPPRSVLIAVIADMVRSYMVEVYIDGSRMRTMLRLLEEPKSANEDGRR